MTVEGMIIIVFISTLIGIITPFVIEPIIKWFENRRKKK